MEDDWLRDAKRLHALASTGAAYTRDHHDRARYDEIASIATAMMARIGHVAIPQIDALLGPHARGYATPKVDVRGAVFDADRILLVREASDGRWALPGGFADIGLTAAENVAKEIREEAGLVVRVDALIGLRHKAKQRGAPDIRDFYKLFFACTTLGASDAARDPDVIEHGFFALDNLPDLSSGRTIAADIEMAFAHRAAPGQAAQFD